MNKKKFLSYLLLLTLALVNVDTLYAMEQEEKTSEDSGSEKETAKRRPVELPLRTKKGLRKKVVEDPHTMGVDTWEKWAELSKAEKAEKRKKRRPPLRNPDDQTLIFGPTATSATPPSQSSASSRKSSASSSNPPKRNLRREMRKKIDNPDQAREKEAEKLAGAAMQDELERQKREANGPGLLEKMKKAANIRHRVEKKEEAQQQHKRKDKEKEESGPSGPQTVIIHGGTDEERHDSASYAAPKPLDFSAQKDKARLGLKRKKERKEKQDQKEKQDEQLRLAREKLKRDHEAKLREERAKEEEEGRKTALLIAKEDYDRQQEEELKTRENEQLAHELEEENSSEDGDPEEVSDDEDDDLAIALALHHGDGDGDFSLGDGSGPGHVSPSSAAHPRAKTGLFGLSAGAAAIGFKNHALNMNNIWFTAGTTAAYELFRVEKLLLKLPLPHVLKQRFANAVRGGLYASVANTFLGLIEVPYPRRGSRRINRLAPLNGWKVIGSYMVIDLVSRYGWDAIKSGVLKSTDEDSQEHTDSDQAPSKLTYAKTAFGWGVKTILAELMVKALE